ncbi:uncharacterized protein AB675_7504 [Cyphellophora attinorum]|uniref:AB hydrolase-1 domain-containing protein n=1 Tax=Cyphellophora attinorum TaxID=1664694 RepID=A0A0N1HU66_9EURO|nr:uncharacterized protein AB675_7504 [Phialophora attinorum]KPI40332.1 hypothetical protein AB675_7504 [Phialophora attinorum]
MASNTAGLSYVKANDYGFAYQKISTSETNPPLILVHGHISDYRTWTAIIPFLSQHFTIYNYSRRFAWPNEPIPDEHAPRWEQDAEDLIAVIQALDIAPCHVLGNSSGAFGILWAAKTHQHLFRSILLEEPPLVPLFYPTLPPGLLDTLKFFITHPISFFPVTYYGAATIGPAVEFAKANPTDYNGTVDIFGPGVLGAEFWKRAKTDPARRQQFEDNAKWLHNFFGKSAIPVYRPEDVGKVTVPALVLTGTDGPWSQQCIDSELFRLFKAAGNGKKDRAWIKGAGHLMQEDEPEKVAEAVKRFVLGI